jgi:hypothetical protein
VALVILYLVRPLWHGITLLVWTAPIVWLPPLLVLAVGAVLLRRSRRSWTTLDDLRAGVRPPSWLAAFPVIAFVLFVLGGSLQGPLTNRAIVNATSYEQIGGLPPGGNARLVPREVAEQNASSAFNSPTETLTDFRIVNTADGLRWTALRTPQGAFRTFTRKSQGFVELDATQTARSLRQVDAELDVAPGPADHRQPALAAAQGALPRAPGGPGRRRDAPGPAHRRALPRVQGRDHPPPGARRRVRRRAGRDDRGPRARGGRAPPELARSGRVFPDTQARRIQDAYAYKGGVWNAWFVHEDQTQITDTETNRQPYLINFDRLGPQWVTVAEPYGRAFAASAIFLTDAVTGRTRVWRVPRRTSLSGNRRALQAVRAVSIPGVDFGDGTPGSGNFRVVEPRPVFVRGRLVYLTSIIPNTANAVSKTVVVDAETNKLVAIFDNDRDPQAEEKTLRYVETGQVADDAAAPGTEDDAAAAEDPADDDERPAGGGGDDPPSGDQEDVERRLDDVIRRQRELLEEVQELRDAVREREGAGR